MITVKRLSIGMQYWFICPGFKVFGKYNGRDKNVFKLHDAFVYYTLSENESFSTEQYFLLDGKKLTDIKINKDDPDGDYSEYYCNEIYD